MDMTIRPRRLRGNDTLRRMVRETRMDKSSLIYPIFVKEGTDICEEIPTMPGQYRYSVDCMGFELERLLNAGVKNVMFFGIPDQKDEVGSGAYNENGIVQRALREAKEKFPELYLITDVCMCEYTSHGHCGMLCGHDVDNDRTLDLLAKTALSHVEAGADMVAPSNMMDGHIAAIREALDEAGCKMTPIMAYSAKMASGYYGPFRDAAHSAPGFGDRKTYQMDYHNPREAMRDIQDDIDEGADIIIIKPALAFLDILKTASWETDMPLCAYNVSGEYSMVKAAAANGWIDEKKIVMENMIGMKRAGAQMIITYHALDVAKWLREE